MTTQNRTGLKNFLPDRLTSIVSMQKWSRSAARSPTSPVKLSLLDEVTVVTTFQLRFCITVWRPASDNRISFGMCRLCLTTLHQSDRKLHTTIGMGQEQGGTVNQSTTKNPLGMRNLKVTTSIIAMILIGLSGSAFAQRSQSLTEILKKHMNETVQAVKEAESADEKRSNLNESFTDMLTAVEKIEEKAELSDREKEQLAVLKDNITAKSNQLNGLDGYDKVGDEELDDFSDYSQQDMEQANRTITISLTTALLIIIILLLL